MRRAFSDFLLSACALGVLVIGLVAMDGRVREEIAARMDRTQASTDIAATTSQAKQMTALVIQAVKDQSEEHRPLMIMLVAGAVLTIVMFRT